MSIRRCGGLNRSGLSIAILVACVAGCGGASSQRAIRSGCSSQTAREPAVGRDLAAFVHNYGLPGAVAAVCTRDGTVHAAAGFSDLRTKRKMRPGDRFWIGSVTKTFVATVVLQLVGEGKLRLDDSVERRLPGVVPRGREITIRELLNHTSGVPDYFADPWVEKQLTQNRRAVIPSRTLIAHAVSHPLGFAPGRDWSYSSTNYLLLGLIVERATGRSVRTELAHRIFEPLRLSNTAFESPGRGLHRSRARGYDVSGGSPRDVTLDTLGGPGAAGAIVSNADDVARFFSALLGGKLLRAEQLHAMKTVRFHDGLGMFLSYPRDSQGLTACPRAWGHGGGTPGYLTSVLASDGGTRVVVVATTGVSGPAGGAVDQTASDIFCLRPP